MPKRFGIGLPNLEQRVKILKLVRALILLYPRYFELKKNFLLKQMLKDTKLSPDFSFEDLAEQADGLSGSDLKELCRNAAMVPVREFMRSTSDNHEALAKGQLEVYSVCIIDLGKITYPFLSFRVSIYDL